MFDDPSVYFTPGVRTAPIDAALATQGAVIAAMTPAYITAMITLRAAMYADSTVVRLAGRIDGFKLDDVEDELKGYDFVVNEDEPGSYGLGVLGVVNTLLETTCRKVHTQRSPMRLLSHWTKDGSQLLHYSLRLGDISLSPNEEDYFLGVVTASPFSDTDAIQRVHADLARCRRARLLLNQIEEETK